MAITKREEDIKRSAQLYLHLVLSEVFDHPDKLKIECVVDLRGVNLILSGDPVDIAKLMGYKGMNIIGVRNLMKMWGKKRNATINTFIPQGEPKK